MYFRGICTQAEKPEYGENDARMDAVRQIIEYFGTEGAFAYKRERKDLEEKIKDEIKVKGSGRVIGAKQQESYCETWEEKSKDCDVGYFYDVYVLVRVPSKEIEEEIDRSKRRAQEIVLGAKRVFDEAGEAASRGNLREASLGFSQVLEALKDCYYIEVPSGVSGDSLVRDSERAVMSLVSSFAVRKAGDHQEARLGELLKEPLTVWISYKWEDIVHPAEGIPVSFRFSMEKEKIAQKVLTDPDGKASLEVSGITSAGLVEASIDFTSLFPGIHADPLVEQFSFKLNDAVMVRVNERMLEKTQEHSIVESEIIRILIEAGHVVVDTGKRFTDADWDLFLRGQPGLVEEYAAERGISTVIFGNAEAVFSQDNSGIMSARANCFIKSIRVSDRKVSGEVGLQEIIGFGNTKGKACREALTKLTGKLSVYILDAMEQEKRE